MKLANIIFIFVFTFFYSFVIHSAQVSWDSMSLDEQANLLENLDYIDESQLPKNLKIINYLDSSFVLNSKLTSFEDLKITNPKHKAYIEKIIQVFEDEVSREGIEQSEYSAFGDPQISTLYLLVDESEDVVAALIGFYQDGRDQEGEESDVNWSAQVRFNSKAEVFADENDQAYDELYFEWSGH